MPIQSVIGHQSLIAIMPPFLMGAWSGFRQVPGLRSTIMGQTNWMFFQQSIFYTLVCLIDYLVIGHFPA
jgi:hypothetical protein